MSGAIIAGGVILLFWTAILVMYNRILNQKSNLFEQQAKSTHHSQVEGFRANLLALERIGYTSDEFLEMKMELREYNEYGFYEAVCPYMDQAINRAASQI